MKRPFWLCSASVLLLSGTARAAAPAIELVRCPLLGEASLREHLSLELTTLGLPDVDSRLRLRCAGSVVVVELTSDAGERYPIEVRVELRDTVPAERERLVALAASELMAQAERARSERVPAESAAPAPGPRALDAARVTAERAHHPHELFVVGSAAVEGEPKTTLWGAGLGARLGLEPRWSLLLDTRFERGDARVRLAGVRWSSLSGFLGAGGNFVAPWCRFSVGLGLRAGWLSLSANADSPHVGYGLTAPWWGVALPLRAALAATARVSPFVGLEGGYVLMPVRGTLDDGTALTAHRGPWLSASVGIGVSL